MLKLINIKKEYKTVNETISALSEINIEFRQNEFVSILGPSGCGKTTLLNIIGGLDRCSAGDLIVNGESTKDYKDTDWDAYRNNRVGFVFQDYNLIPHLTVLGNVELSLTLSGFSKEQRKKLALQAIKKVGLEDKIDKKPNQLSGGQMQRVAIARAIVNNPDIILADEPTGALDSKTSIEIMNILKKISNEKLVIMVTHNSQLAQSYSNRIINLLDGKVVADTNTYECKENKDNAKVNKKTSLNFLSAISLSFKNLLTKKVRTCITAIASSIGIMGVALVLALSNGVNKTIDKFQDESLSTYPLTISDKTSINLDDFAIIANNVESNLKGYPNSKEIYMLKSNLKISDVTNENNITQEYVDDVIENIDPSLINGINYGRNVEMNLFTNGGAMKQVSNGKDMHVKLVTDFIWQQALDNYDFNTSQYDVLEGKFPQNYNEIAISVDMYNRINDTTLLALGLHSDNQDKKVYSFDEILNTEFKLLTNDEMYSYDGNHYNLNGVYINNHPMITNEAYNSGENIKIVGIIRMKEETLCSAYRPGVVYTSGLIDYILEKNKNSSLASYMEENVNINPFTGEEYLPTSEISDINDIYKKDLKKYGIDSTPTSIYIYPKNYEAKEKIKDYLDNYNQMSKNKISYIDITSLLMFLLEFMTEGVSSIMLAVSYISLIVSAIMIAIITYVSTIERTKEIGVLRSIGARKKDVITIFNAENFIIGFISGVVGIIIAMIISIPINIYMRNLGIGLIKAASFNFVHIALLLAINIILNIFSGLIPAIIASKKHPVIALKSE